MSVVPRAILITGANRGLGLEFIRQIVRLPTPPKHLIATCRDPDAATSLQEIASSHSCVKVIKLDVCNTSAFGDFKESVSSLLQGEGLNLLVNNAGIHIRGGLLDVTPEFMVAVYQTNVIAPVILTQTLVPLLKLAVQNCGDAGMSWCKAAVVNISSDMASIQKTQTGGFYPYRASKAALNMVTKTMSIDLKTDQILAMAIHPGWVQTDMGGTRAPVTLSQSIDGMLNIFSKLNEDTSGTFMDYTGKTMPW